MADLIDRKEAIKVISNDSLDVKCFCVIGRGQENRELAKTINDYVDLLLETAKRKILSLPKAGTERYAHWVKNEDGLYHCENCPHYHYPLEFIKELEITNCPHCGYEMDEVVGDE